MRLKHILVPTDFGAASERAVDLAVTLAAPFDAKVTLLHVWSVPTPMYTEALRWPTEEVEQAAHAAMAERQARLLERHRNSEGLVVAGTTWERIIEIAGERGVDLIVMGTHGRRGVPHILLGSVAERVVRLSPVPVLTVKAPAG